MALRKAPGGEGYGAPDGSQFTVLKGRKLPKGPRARHARQPQPHVNMQGFLEKALFKADSDGKETQLTGSTAPQQPPHISPDLQEIARRSHNRDRFGNLRAPETPQTAASGGGEHRSGKGRRRLRAWVRGLLLTTVLAGVSRAIPQAKKIEDIGLKNLSTLVGANGQPGHVGTQPTPRTEVTSTPANHENKDVTAQYSTQLTLFRNTLKEAGVNPGQLTATEVWGQTYNQNGQEVDGNYVVFKDGTNVLATYGQYQESNGTNALRFDASQKTGYEGSRLAVQYYLDQRASAYKDDKPMPLINAVVIPEGAVVTTTPFVFHGSDGDYYGFKYEWTIDGKTQVIDVLGPNSNPQVWGNNNGEHVPQNNEMLFDQNHVKPGDRLDTSYDFYAGKGATLSKSFHPGLPVVDGASGTVSVTIDGSKNAQLIPTSLTLTMPDGTQAPVEFGLASATP